MNKIKLYLTNLPYTIKILILFNLSIYILFFLFNYIFNIDLNYLFGAYPSCSEHFDYYRILTFMFSHSLNVTHVISNVLILIIFGPLVCVNIGNKNTFFVYIFSGLLSFLLFNNQKNYENMMIKKDMTNIGINVNDIKQNELGQVNFNKFKTYTDKQLTYLEFYPFTNSFLIGSSGPIFSFVTMYLLFSLKKPKNTFLMVISLLLISKEVVFYFFRDVTISGTIFGHIGGIFGGILFFIILFALNKKRVT